MKKLENYKKDELLILKSQIDSRLRTMEEQESMKNYRKQILQKMSSKDLKLKNLKNGDKIFYVDFDGQKIFNHGAVGIWFDKTDNDEYVKFSTQQGASLLCSSSIRNECMDNHYFMVEFTSCFYFFTLKPNDWKIDIKLEAERIISNRKEHFRKEIKDLKRNIMDLINNHDDIFLTKH